MLAEVKSYFAAREDMGPNSVTNRKTTSHHKVNNSLMNRATSDPDIKHVEVDQRALRQ